VAYFKEPSWPSLGDRTTKERISQGGRYKSRSSGMWRHILMWWNKSLVSPFSGSKFLRNVGILLHHYMVS
jgi:hypothetical protein